MDTTAMRLDRKALRRVATELGTLTKVDTINAALHEIIKTRGHRRLMALLAASDLGNPEVMSRAWRT